eukprot:TRINITY_DN11027_c0_g1_i2.p1 TRINITY_DN11027_c0_g1~~TRINITY_DN11027_c0_g1_i2.p1  ORF type:complete len:641 (-),score=139.45 TRINITY_DN11027_c0_g1_i2:449-2371(-)
MPPEPAPSNPSPMAKDPPPSPSPPIAVKDAVYKLQLALLDGIHSEYQLFSAGSLLSRSDYEDVVTERSISNLCGYPLCPNSLPSDRSARKGRFKISREEKKLLDLRETGKYCSSACHAISKTFTASFNEERRAVSDPGKILEVLGLFGELSLEDKGKKNGAMGVSELKILDKADAKAVEVSLEDWIGPSNAIEGYVPRDRSDLSSLPMSAKHQEKGSKPKETGTVEREEVLVGNETDFVSTVIIGDQLSASEASMGPQKNDSKPKANRKSKGKDIVEKAGKQSETQSRSALSKGPQGEVSVAAAVGKQNGTQLKSALKSSGVNPLSRNVTWADEKKAENMDAGNLFNGQKNKEKSESIKNSSVSEVNDESSLRFALAEACAIALSQAAEAVASGECDAEDAATEAGIVILPPVEVDEGNSSELMDVSELDHQSVKWPRKPVLLDADLFDCEDSWHDTPPEGFSLTLSPFATMWTALFGWLSASSLAYIYGRDESSQDDFLFVNGREYPRKVALSDGLSSEIKQTFAGCVSRSLPGVVADLRLPTPISFLEQFLGRLLDTMSYVDPLPPFRTNQWKVIVLLFIDALSVCRIPALTQYMSSKRMLLHKVLDSAQVGGEEYEVMKDLLIPLGRQPEFSAQSGG